MIPMPILSKLCYQTFLNFSKNKTVVTTFLNSGLVTKLSSSLLQTEITPVDLFWMWSWEGEHF